MVKIKYSTSYNFTCFKGKIKNTIKIKIKKPGAFYLQNHLQPWLKYYINKVKLYFKNFYWGMVALQCCVSLHPAEQN